MEFLSVIAYYLGNLFLISTFIIGIILFGYGLYGSTVSGFNKEVRNFCLVVGAICILVIAVFYFS